MSADDKPSWSERYAAAIGSSHLEMVSNKRGAIDLLTAVGMCRVNGDRESLGSMLMRLQCEFDAAHGEYSMVRRNQARSLMEARDKRDPAQIAAMEHAAEVEALLAHKHILLKIPSFARTRKAFERWCMIQAHKRNFMADDPNQQRVIGILASRVLDVFLEPTCLRCSGRGFLGSGYEGKMQTFCPTRGGCGGAGKRDVTRIGNNKDQHDFSYHLYCSAHRLLQTVESQLAQKMRN